MLDRYLVSVNNLSSFSIFFKIIEKILSYAFPTSYRFRHVSSEHGNGIFLRNVISLSFEHLRKTTLI